jgi:hypothetical protein
MSAARVLHFGEDECHRLIVLHQAGYDAVLCHSGPHLVQQMQQPDFDAVLFPRLPAKRLLLNELRASTIVPFVLFGFPLDPSHPAPFDLIIDPITDPAIWLRQLSQTIGLARDVRKRSALVRSQSATLRGESEAVRLESQAAQENFRQTRAKFPPNR